MDRLIDAWLKVGISTHVFAGIILAIMFLVTLADVTLRLVWTPIPGAYELISFLGGLVIGFAVPHTSQVKGHINVDFVTEKMAERPRNVVDATTRLMAMIFFLLIGWSLISIGMDLHTTKVVSPTFFKVPYYPVAFGLGLAFLIQAAQYFLDFFRICRGSHE
ncbi:MAG: TRAP transporter small permease [Syntrophorhabdales bacterium]|jgi:TRAP-type C4-dicarboxylate transport system permease small subunit